MKHLVLSFMMLLFVVLVIAQGKVSWQNVDAQYAPLPGSLHVYFSQQSIDTSAFRAFYLIADLRDKQIEFLTDTTYQRRLTPQQFFQKNQMPLVVVNGTFFSFATNQNLNAVVKNGKLVSYNLHHVPGRGSDTLTYRHSFGSAIGISKKRKADIAWLYTDSLKKFPYAMQFSIEPIKDSIPNPDFSYIKRKASLVVTPHSRKIKPSLKKWKMKTVIGGGPVLVQNSTIAITNNEELKFAGNAIHDKHPRTAIGYTADHHLVILVVEGRNPKAGGASLIQLAHIMKDLGCVEALNLDGGGSSCLLVNGKETIRPSDKIQRPVPAVLLIQD